MLNFHKLIRPKNRKTETWTVSCKGYPLGNIRWYAGWRRYVFYPNPGTLFDPICLRILADFCGVATQEHKA